METRTLPFLTRIPRIDTADYDFVLLHISSTGDRPFDLRIIGTENEQPYVLKIKSHRISDYQDKKFAGTAEQWEEVLSVVLLGASAKTNFTEGVEAVAKTDRKASSITINIQKSIEGIKQKLGSLSLTASDKIEPDLFEWCGLTIKANQNTIRELADLKEQLRAKNSETKRLSDTLTELVTAKNAHEDDLAGKYSILLNEKKLKIREQQRLLASANVDTTKLAEMERNRIPQRDSSPEPSRAGKRKADAVKEEDEDEDTDEAFEKMEVDEAEQDPEDRRTEDEDSTTDEDDDNDMPLPTRTKNSEASGSASSSREAEIVIPPKRDLPFSKKTPPIQKPASPMEGSETESDDDEL